jgi:hypothetical protein
MVQILALESPERPSQRGKNGSQKYCSPIWHQQKQIIWTSVEKLPKTGTDSPYHQKITSTSTTIPTNTT